jgi:hypothetical protein
MKEFLEREFWDTANRVELFVACPKSLEEFTASLDAVLEPLRFEAGSLAIGAITLSCSSVSAQPPVFEALPVPHYTCLVSVAGPTPFGFWGALQWHLVVALSTSIRTRFSCQYLALLERRAVLFYSGTNERCLVNERWPAHVAYGSLLAGKSTLHVNVPLVPEHAAA